MKSLHLEEAYKLALPVFKGRLEQTFIVLKDAEVEKVATGSNNVPMGIKRTASEILLAGDPKRPAN